MISQNADNKKFSLFLILLAVTSYLILFAYGLVQPLSNSFLVTSFGPDGLPYAWILTAFLVIFVTYAYNKLLGLVGVRWMFLGIILGICALTVFFWWWLQVSPKIASLVFYTFKDIYILLLVEQVWSLANSTCNMKQAKWFYGLFATSGALGSLSGNYIIKAFTISAATGHLQGSYTMLLYSIIPHLLLAVFFLMAMTKSDGVASCAKLADSVEKPHFRLDSGLKLFREFRFLIFLLCIVGLIQLSTSLSDFYLNQMVAKSITGLDERSQFFGNLFFWINNGSFVLQLIVTPLALNFVGVLGTHLFFPLVLFFGFIVLIFVPQLFLISSLYGFMKASDYSILRIAREVLYLPVTTEAKYKAKAIIDVYVYRSAKVLSSLIILILKKLVVSMAVVLPVTIALFLGLWCLCIPAMMKRWKKAGYQS